MPRRAWVIVPGMPHSIVQRGHNRDVVFIDEVERRAGFNVEYRSRGRITDIRK